MPRSQQIHTIAFFLAMTLLSPLTSEGFSGFAPTDSSVNVNIPSPEIVIDGLAVDPLIVGGIFKLDYMNSQFLHPGTSFETFLPKNRDRIIDIIAGRELLARQAVQEGLRPTPEKKQDLLEQAYSRFNGREVYLKNLAAYNISQEEYEAVIVHAFLARSHLDRWATGENSAGNTFLERFYEATRTDYTTPRTWIVDHYFFTFPREDRPGKKEIDQILASIKELRRSGDLAERISALREQFGEDITVSSKKGIEVLEGTRGIVAGKGRQLSPDGDRTVWWAYDSGRKQNHLIYYHVVHLDRYQPLEIKPFDQVREQVREALFEERYSRGAEMRVKQLLENARVVINP